MTIRTAIVFLLLALASGCAGSKYSENYQPAPGASAAATSEPAKIRRARDIGAETGDLQRAGYQVLGTVDFTATLRSDEELQAQAIAVGATLVLKQNTFLETKTVDKTVYKPNSTTDNTTRVGRGSPRTTATQPADPLARKGSIEHTEQQSLYRHQAVFLRR